MIRVDRVFVGRIMASRSNTAINPFPGKWPTRMSLSILKSRDGRVEPKVLWEYVGKPDLIAWRKFQRLKAGLERGKGFYVRAVEFDLSAWVWWQETEPGRDRALVNNQAGFLYVKYHPWETAGMDVFGWMTGNWEMEVVRSLKGKRCPFYVNLDSVKGTPGWKDLYRKHYGI